MNITCITNYCICKEEYVTDLIIVFLFVFYIRDKTNCQTSFTTTLDMKRNDVVYGSKVGNTTNPQYLKVDNWVTSLIIVHLNIYFSRL